MTDLINFLVSPFGVTFCAVSGASLCYVAAVGLHTLRIVEDRTA